MTKEEFVKEATKYVERGISVIPVGANKIPLIPWKEFQTRIPNTAEIMLWGDSFPELQLGIVTGKISNLTIVDVEAEGDPSFLPQNTSIVKTGGGGWHYYFSYCSQMKNQVRSRPFVDIRSEGGYVVGPGSTSTKGKYELLSNAILLDFPLHLFKDDKSLSSTPKHVSTGSIEPHNASYALSSYPGFGQGQRNNQITSFIGGLLREIFPADWESYAWPIVVAANNKNTPPIGEGELRRTFESIMSAERNNPDGLWNQSRASEMQLESWADNDDDSLAHLAEVARSSAIDISKFYETGFDIFDKEIRGGFIPGDLIIVAAASGEGKTSWCQHVAFNFIKKLKEKVLFLTYEVLPQFVWEKFQSMGLSEEEDMVVTPMKHTTGKLEWVEKKIKEAIEKFGAKMIVIDHLGFLIPKDKKGQKNNSDNVALNLTSIARELKRIAIDNGIIIVAPAHMRKRIGGDKRKNTDIDMNDIAYSAGIYQEADLVFMIKREESPDQGAVDVYTGWSLIFLAKNRRGKKNPKGYFKMIDDFFIYDATYKMPDSLIPGVTVKGESRKLAEEAINAALEREHERDMKQSSFINFNDFNNK